MSRGGSPAPTRERDEVDVVEIKKALATGASKDATAPGASASSSLNCLRGILG